MTTTALVIRHGPAGGLLPIDKPKHRGYGEIDHTQGVSCLGAGGIPDRAAGTQNPRIQPSRHQLLR